jgi:hypothetical protein
MVLTGPTSGVAHAEKASEPVSIPGVQVLTERPTPVSVTPQVAAALERAKAAAAKNSDVLAPPFVDRVSGELVVPMVGSKGVAAAQRSVAGLGAGVRSRQVRVNRSVAKLESIKNEVLTLSASALPGARGAYASYVDAENNRVVVEAGAVGQPMLTSLRSRYGAGSVAVLYVKGASGGMPAARDSDTSPFYGGANIDIYHFGDAAGGCTSGFSWFGPANQQWMITAGHCVPFGNDGPLLGTTVKTPRMDMGSIQVHSENWNNQTGTVLFSGQSVNRGDIARVTVNPSVAGRIFSGAAGPTSETLQVGGLHAAHRAGNQFCTSGSRSGNHCGWVADWVDGNWRYGNGAVARNVTSASKMGQCVIPGDSGGPAYVASGGKALAYGIISGASGFGGSDNFAGPGEGPCRNVITDTQDVKAAFGGTLVTQ